MNLDTEQPMPTQQKSIVGTFFFALLGFMLFSSGSNTVYAQTEITGTVYDAETQETLPGVNILIKGTARGTSTDPEGNFRLRLQEGESILVFSFLGFETQEIDVTGLTEIEVQLRTVVGTLDELVVVGYGVVKKRDVTGAIGRVSSEELGKVTSLNVEQALQGKVSGVQITSTSGAPGAAAAVRIRGVGTFNDSSPIYVVDGVILDDISFLNSADIESMEVLKDASATAIYGSRGANGVVLVQTKSGSGIVGKPQVNFSTETGFQQVERTIDLLNGREYAIIANEIRSGTYNNVDAVPNTDWQDLVFGTAPIQNHQLSVSGGSDRGDYYVSVGYFQQDGIIEKSSYERLTIKLNNTYKLNEKIKIGNNLTIAPYKQQIAPNATFAAYRAQPLLEPFYDDGSFGVVYNVGNPLADIEYSNNQNSGTRFVGNIFADAIIKNEFLLRSSFGIDASLNRARNFTPAFTVLNPDGTASQQNNDFSDIFKQESINYNWLWENTLSYIKEYDRHSVNAVGGLSMQQTRSEFLQLSGQNVIRDDEDFWYVNPSYIIDEANGINNLQANNNGVDAGNYFNMISLLGRVVYTYNQKYVATLTYRADGSSKFAEENRWGYFPSVAFGWNIDQEKFMGLIPEISSLKLRTSWGIIGNEKIQYLGRFSGVNSDILAVFGSPDTPYNAATYGTSGNPDLQWESTTQIDVGIEGGLFEDKLSVEIDYYNRTTSDILIDLSTPGHLGNGQGQRITFNAAEVQNKGIEFNIAWQDRVGDIAYSIGFLGNTIDNEVQAIGGNSGIDSVLVGGFLANGQSVTRSVVGRPIGAFYGYKTDGIFQNQAELDAYPHLSQADVGDLRFVDVNGDGVLNGEDRTFIGSPIPDFVYGFNLDLFYKNFDLSIGLQGQIGNEIFNGKNVVRPDPYNFEQHVWNRWTGEGTSNSEPRVTYGGYNFLPSDRFIHDGSFLRLRTVIIGYQLPPSYQSRLGLREARLYVKANNLLTITQYTGYTPEIGSQSVIANGIDTGIYPIPRVISVGFNTSF
ncbi:MAG: TonB-dependent receptor [Balneola sp.]|nr:MAG: TonB-dependent receptor [Balneola sp.]